MNGDLENLVVLQAQDLELARLRAELAELPRLSKAALDAVTGAEATLTAHRQKLSAEDKLRRGHESDIASLRSKLERVRRSLDSATSAQQVAAFQHEIDFSEAGIARLEEEAFASLERSEVLEAELLRATTALDRAKGAQEQERARAAGLQVHNAEAIAGIERERATLRAAVSVGRLLSYDKLAKTRGTAVAEALGNATAGKCAACQMGVRPQRWQDLIGKEHLDEIFTCESCGRMLFWDPRRDTPRTWAAGERFQAAFAGTPSKGAGGVR